MANINCAMCSKRFSGNYRFCPYCGAESEKLLVSKLSTQGRVVLPTKLMEKLEIVDGDYVVFELNSDGLGYTIKKHTIVNVSTRDNNQNKRKIRSVSHE